MTDEELAKIKIELGTRTVSDDLIEQYYDDMLAIAQDYYKIDDDIEKSAVRRAVVKLINRQGDEGIASATGGSQSYTYEDAVAELKNELRTHRKGVKTI